MGGVGLAVVVVAGGRRSGHSLPIPAGRSRSTREEHNYFVRDSGAGRRRCGGVHKPLSASMAGVDTASTSGEKDGMCACLTLCSLGAIAAAEITPKGSKLKFVRQTFDGLYLSLSQVSRASRTCPFVLSSFRNRVSLASIESATILLLLLLLLLPSPFQADHGLEPSSPPSGPPSKLSDFFLVLKEPIPATVDPTT